MKLLKTIQLVVWLSSGVAWAEMQYRFPIDVMVHEDAQEINNKKWLLSDALTPSKELVTFEDHLQTTGMKMGNRLQGFVVATTESEKLATPILVFDKNENGKVDANELRIKGELIDVGSVHSRKPTAGGRAVVYLETNCRCAAVPDSVCWIKEDYIVKIIHNKTGDVLWGTETIEKVLNNNCSFTAILGKHVPIPEDVLKMEPEDISILLKTPDESLGQIVPIHAPLKPSAQMGPPGPKGDKGEKGDKGDKGDRGEVGAKGERGDRGEAGAVGPMGPKGVKGESGESGLIGPQGPQGPQGPRGETGPAGLPGPQGPQGERGEKGEKGDKGDKGDPGPPGGGGPNSGGGPNGGGGGTKGSGTQ